MLHRVYGIGGLWLPLTALTCAWAAINPGQTMLFNFILQIQARWLALIMVGIVYFEEFKGDPPLGVFSLIAPALAWYYVQGNWAYGRSRGYARRGPDLRITQPGTKTTLDGSSTRLNPVQWFKDWQEKRRLRKLWRNSGFSDRDFKR